MTPIALIDFAGTYMALPRTPTCIIGRCPLIFCCTVGGGLSLHNANALAVHL